ncbi:alanine/glycine:cation symporter family protein [Pseudoramibacter sp.]|jgi:AGCS family alanine or glycine:cation symporter|uniref:alanine/glycine:cation symporter family protein n=1 Tax=Pseudoramibacter sp. TaxID=2034862 RepID=UPI0025FE8B15|nr:alanine/glycine:cation symporter family protein [Pseudoramibacter sp.]MCH4072114.1 alanine:cation symporter family protein [Pseudoramibacter sp.]MCH4105884.1 alanine:cation symporter family protein [Pseudoramibacter sp.]
MNFLTKLNGIVWSVPMMLILLGVSIAYCIGMRFGTMRNWKMQFKLLGSDSGEEGISPLQTFFTVTAYRVAVGNVSGVALAISYGGPGAVFWMIVTALLTSGIAFAENVLGQTYKIRQDGQYRGGTYNYIEGSINAKWLAIVFAVLALLGVPLVVSGQSANQIGLAFQQSLGIKPVVTGIIIAVLLFVIISGGIKRIAKFSTFIVPVVTVMYFVVMVIVMVVNRQNIPSMFCLIISSAFNKGSVFGGMMGAAVQFGVKRSVNSSGAGMGETPCTAAVAENRHPAQQGLVNAFTIYLNIIVCFCSSFLILVSDCYNVTKVPNSVTQGFRYVGHGSPVLAAAAKKGLAADITWVQAAANTALPKVGGFIIALAITFFAFSTVVSYYYEGESALAYLMHGSSNKKRSICMFVLRIAMCVMFFVWSTQSADMAWKAGEIALGLMVWINIIVMIPTFSTVIKIYNDFIKQWKSGEEDPYFNPQKLGIKNCDIWMDINKDRIEADEVKAKAASSAET